MRRLAVAGALAAAVAGFVALFLVLARPPAGPARE